MPDTQPQPRIFRERLLRLLLRENDTDDQTPVTADQAEAIAAALIREAKKGSIPAFTAIRDSIGEKPTDKPDQTQTAEVQIFKLPDNGRE